MMPYSVERETVETRPHVCFMHYASGVLYVPHYSKPGVYVGPGWKGRCGEGGGEVPEFSTRELLDRGAVRCVQQLMVRAGV